MDALAELTSALADRYEIDREIGAGGMANVYLARDIKHQRRVALKVLKPELGAILGVERFLAEIRLTANLQHPNLLPLFDSGEAGGLLYYVMPYVEGESLRGKLDREKQLPLDEAVRMATAIAGALDYAHRQGVVHRDLKPENILLHEGQPLVADFGIALAVSNAGGNRITQSGLSLGTPQYMSPEQATGDRVIDGRTDIYSLGAVLYEMLVGDPPHLGSTAQAVIAKVLTEKPPHVRSARDTVPENVDRAIEHALAKLPADRFATAAKFADALNTDSGSSISSSYGATSHISRRTLVTGASVWPWIVALILSIALGTWGTVRPRAADANAVRFLIALPPGQEQQVQGLALSPDASVLVYGTPAGLVVRSMSEVETHLISGTAGASAPFFSTDGNSVGFQSGSQLKRVSIGGGTPLIIADSLPIITGGSWARDGRIVIHGRDHGLALISSSGGRLRSLTKPLAGERHMFPEFLPNGKGVVFSIWRGAIQSVELATADLDGNVTKLGIRGLGPHYADGNLIFAHFDGSLAMVPFDPKTRRAGSDERSLGEIVQVFPPSVSNYAVSTNGSLTYLGGALPNQPALVDRSGLMRPLPVASKTYARPRFSPDGTRLLFDTRGAAFGELWLYDIRTETPQRLYAGEDVHQPEWRPDGKLISFTAGNDTTAEDLFTMPLDGSSRPEPLMKLDGDQYDASWTPDGGSLVYIQDDPFPSIAVVNTAEKKPKKWLGVGDGATSVSGPRVSPDGRWLAYWSNQSGREEVFVRSFPNNGGVIQISSEGGTEPVWSRSGRAIYYRQGDKLVMATLLTTPDLTVQKRNLLFAQSFASDGSHTFYDVSPDDKSFIFLKNSNQAQIVVVMNWTSELRRTFVQR